MLRRLTVLLAALAAMGVALLAPAAALACTSAVCVYSPQSGGPGGSHADDGATPQASAHVSRGVQAKLSRSHATGQDKNDLLQIMKDPNVGSNGPKLADFAPGDVVSPSAFGALFNLGAGPLALIAVLIGSALALLVASGWRGWQRWRRRLMA